MSTTPDGYYNIHKRTRHHENGESETELLFLYKEIPLELVEKVDNTISAFISNAEDREVEVNLLGETFIARLIRPIGHWFEGQESFGVELSYLLSEYFGIDIYKKERYDFYNQKPRRVAYTTWPEHEYVYELESLEKGTEGKTISKEQCPINQKRESRYSFNKFDECVICPFQDFVKDKNGKTIQQCFCPKLKWTD